MPNSRGHRYAGGCLSSDKHTRRHYGADVLVVAAIASAVVAAGASAYAGYAASEAQADAADYNKKVARNQAALATQQAEIDAQNLHERNRRILAQELAVQAGSGVETTEGSPLLVRADTARQMARDEYLTRYGGAVRAGGYEQQAGLQSLYASNYRSAAEVGAGVSLLSSGAGITRSYAYRNNPNYMGG